MKLTKSDNDVNVYAKDTNIVNKIVSIHLSMLNEAYLCSIWNMVWSGVMRATKSLQKVCVYSNQMSVKITTVQKTKFSIRDFFSKCDQIRSFLRIWSHLLKKSYIKNFIFCAMHKSMCFVP